jgi:hypothetical protein
MPGVWNNRLGWLLLLAGFCAAIGLDPWSLSERDAAALPGSVRMAARHAQAVLVAMGFLQIAVAYLLREGALSQRLRHLAGPVLAVGTLIYAAGYVGLNLRPGGAWLIVLGAAINGIGFALLNWTAWRAPTAAEVRVVLAVFLLGMVIDIMCGLYVVDAEHLLSIDLGPEDGVRQRMLRLARVAATALSLLTLLYRERAVSSTPWHRPARIALMIGTVGMPTVLVAACFVDTRLKYLLPIPALAMTGGVIVALLEARRTASPLELWGWLLVAVSMNVGLLVGLYAFDGPLPTPGFVGTYNEFARRLSRLGHAYCIALGLLAILLARQAAGRVATVLFIAGSSVMVLATVLLAFLPDLTALLVPGPLLVALALVAGVHWDFGPQQKRDIPPGQEPEKVGDKFSQQRNLL